MARTTRPSADEIQRRIRERAYALWEAQGQPHGRDREHWLQAEAEITAATRPRSAKTRPRSAR